MFERKTDGADHSASHAIQRAAYESVRPQTIQPKLTLKDAGIPDTGAVPLSSLKFVEGHIRCLVWGRCHVRSGESEWDTDWKWMIGSWTWWLASRRNDEPSNPSSWYIPGLHDSKNVQISNVQITYVAALPGDPS